MDIITKNFQSGRVRDNIRYAPEAVVLHITDGTFNSTKAWFKNPRSQVSAHWIVDTNGKRYSVVDEEDTAWHAGLRVNPKHPLVIQKGVNPNSWTIGVEAIGFTGVFPRFVQWISWVRLVKEICKRWNIPMDNMHIIDHNEIRSNKSCPGKWFSKKFFLILSKVI